MSPASQERVAEMRRIVRDVLEGKASAIFLGRVDAILDDWGSGKAPAAEACEKVQKMVALHQRG